MLSLQLAQNEWLKEIHNDAVYTRGIVNILYTKDVDCILCFCVCKRDNDEPTKSMCILLFTNGTLEYSSFFFLFR